MDHCVAFEKYDGTNLHFRWHRDFGWHAFGTRRDEFNFDNAGEHEFARRHKQLWNAPELFRTSLADQIADVLRGHVTFRESEEVTVFAEYFGEHSFAGLHKNEDAKRLVVFDVMMRDRWILGPLMFLEVFRDLPVARVVFQGRFTGAFAEDVRIGKYNVTEGVVCKAGTGGDDLTMAKIKTYAYMKRLKDAFGQNWEQYWE